MEDIVAARVRDDSGKWYGFMTFDRIVNRVDNSWLLRSPSRRCGKTWDRD